LGISQRLSYTLLAVPSGYPTAFKSLSQRLLAKTWQYPSLFSEERRFLEHFLKFEAAFTNFINHQRLLS
jgi:hypothetical protein